MQYQAILFDLDGTLLPMDQDLFLKAYFSALVKKLAPLGYDPKALTDAIWAGTGAMIHNDGQRTNEAAFWDCFARILGEQARREAPVLEAFYHNEFQQVRHVCGYTSAAKELLDALKAKGLRRILATNPLFPAIATESRIRWAGLEPSDFELYTTYENSRYCKPNPAYYRDILTAAGLSPEECIMVGNDVGDDMVARKLGMGVFLLTDCLINHTEEPIDAYPHGGFPQLAAFLDAL